jgi:hypothetical protein
MEWNIVDLKTKRENGYIVEATTSCSHTEESGRSIVINTSVFTNESEDNFIPFEDLTENEVLSWVKQDLGQSEVDRIQDKVVSEAISRNNYIKNSEIKSRKLNV